MKYRIAIVPLAVFGLNSASQASEGPRFGASGPVELGDGRHLEMRLLYGERFLNAARSRVVVIDENRRVLAKSRSSRPMSLVCTNTICSGYDHSEDKILEVDPDSFRRGPIVPDRQRPDLYAIEESEGEWGFKEREATTTDWLFGEIALATEKPFGIMLIGIIGTVAALFAAMIVAIWRSRKTSPVIILVEMVFMIFSAIGILMLILISLYFAAAVFGLTLTTWLSSLVSGALCGVAAAATMRSAVRAIRGNVSI